MGYDFTGGDSDTSMGPASGGGWFDGVGDWFGGLFGGGGGGGGGGLGMDPLMMGLGALGGLLGGGGGTRVSVSSTSTANNNIAFNPVIQAITGMGNPSSPSISAPTSTSISPSASSNASGSDSSSSNPLAGLLGGTTAYPYGGRIDTSQLYPGAGTGTGADGVALGVKTNSQTMLWVILAGGIGALILLSGGNRSGGRR